MQLYASLEEGNRKMILMGVKHNNKQPMTGNGFIASIKMVMTGGDGLYVSLLVYCSYPIYLVQ